jgi:signal transduction histidine kinase
VLTLGDPGFELWRRFSRGLKCESDHPVVARWARVKRLRASARGLGGAASNTERALGDRRARLAALSREGSQLLTSSAAELRRRGCALAFADGDGVLLASYGADAIPDGPPRDAFQVGVKWDERTRGTNAIGTALAEDTSVTVVGRAHCDLGSQGLVCYAAPIHDTRGDLVAVLDVTGPLSVADPLLGVTVQSLAAAVEGLLRAQAVEELAHELETVRERETEAWRSRDELAATLQQNETFLATIGHDLRTPLAAMVTSAEILLKQAEEGKDSQAAQRIRASGRRMVGMVDELYDLARARLGSGIPVHRRPAVDLGAIAERIIGELRVAHPDRPIELEQRGDARGHWDESRLGQVVSNLTGNAIRHGAAPWLVRATIDGSHADAVVLAIANAGEIDPAARPYIFEPFRSGGAHGEGLGLGLYIVEQIVRAHEGRIDVTSKDGRTLFRVTLPRMPSLFR